MAFPSLEVELPDWVDNVVPEEPLASVGERMALAVELSRLNVERGTGGPFGAAVFDTEGELVAPGVNLVPSEGNSVLHAEVVAVALAHRSSGRLELEGMELVSSTEPCVMCLGVTHWSGVDRLVCGARGEDAEDVGFDEGPKLSDWVGRLGDRGISVVRDVEREAAAEVLELYLERGGEVYGRH